MVCLNAKGGGEMFLETNATMGSRGYLFERDNMASVHGSLRYVPVKVRQDTRTE